MATRVAFGLVVLGMFALIAGGLLPGMHNAPTQDLDISAQVYQGQPTDLSDGLVVNATDVNESDGNATVTVFDDETLESESNTLSVGGNETYTIRGENVTVSLDRVESNTSVVVTATYPALYGYAEGPRFVFENLGLLTVLFGGVMVVVLVGVSMQS